jgi:hypothetical protein
MPMKTVEHLLLDLGEQVGPPRGDARGGRVRSRRSASSRAASAAAPSASSRASKAAWKADRKALSCWPRPCAPPDRGRASSPGPASSERLPVKVHPDLVEGVEVVGGGDRRQRLLARARRACSRCAFLIRRRGCRARPGVSAWPRSGAQGRRSSRQPRVAAWIAMAAAAATFSDSARGCSAMATVASSSSLRRPGPARGPRCRARGTPARPAASRSSGSAAGRVEADEQVARGPGGGGHLGERHPGHDRQVVGRADGGPDRLRREGVDAAGGEHHAAAPSASAVRRIVPALPGSATRSRTTTTPAPTVSSRAVTVRATATIPWGVVASARWSSTWSATTSTGCREHAARAALSATKTSSTTPAASASCTARGPSTRWRPRAPLPRTTQPPRRLDAGVAGRGEHRSPWPGGRLRPPAPRARPWRAGPAPRTRRRRGRRGRRGPCGRPRPRRASARA